MTLSYLRRIWSVLALLVLLSLSLPAAHAADVNARIKGTVTDSSGAVIPGALVTATNTATGVVYKATAGKDGGYLFAELPIGTYKVAATATGFKTYSTSGITLSIDQEYVATIKMTVGAGESIDVAADPVQVNTTDMQLNNVVDSTEMVELPLVGRNFTGLELIEPGVQSSSDRFGTYSVSGAQTQQSEFLINGADSNDIALNTLAIAPNLDAIDQFNLIDGPLNAEYDRNSGGIVSATIKQGTNKFHGNVFEFYRDTFLNTLSFFQKNLNSSGLYTGTVSPYHQNIFGGTLGGPILRDKLFFFVAYTGTHQRTPGNTQNNVYSSNNINQGNFASDVPLFTSNIIPSTITSLASASSNCTPNGKNTWAGCLGSTPGGLNGILPTTSFNPISKALVAKYVPLPNSAGYTYSTFGANTSTTNQYLGRIDYALNSKNQFTFVGIYQRTPSTSVVPFTGASLPGFGEIDTSTINQYSFDYVHQFSSSLVNDFAAHWTRFNYQAVEPQNVVAPSSLGFSINPENTAAASVPTISVSGVNTQFTLGFSTNGPQPRIDQVYQLDDSVSKTLGRHQLKFGYDGRRFNVSNPFSANNSGSYSFDTNGTYTTGDPAVDFLLGIPDTYGQGSGATIQADAFLNYFFAQDTWKVADNFTLDYGIGYSIDTPLRNHQYSGEAIACFIPGEQSVIFPTAPVGIVYPGDKGCTDSAQAKTRHTEFGPRFGFAWTPNLGIISAGDSKKFSIRGGFGIYYDRTEEETSLQTLETPPFGATTAGATDFGGSPSFANPFADINGGGAEANKFPFTFPTKGQAVSPNNYAPYYYFSTYGPSFRAPYAENVQLSIEREFPSRVIARVSYVGSLARHNQITYEGNPITQQGHDACAKGSEVSPVLGFAISCTANRNNQTLYFPNNTAYGSIYAPTGYPGFTNAGVVGSEGNSNYNGLQASVEKGLTHGLFVQVSYTYSHAMDNGSSFENSGFGGSTRGYNQYNQSLNYGDSAYDARQRLVIAPIYVAPRFSGEWYSVRNLTLSGWEVSGITTLATGFPYDISYGGASSNSLFCSYYGTFYACPDVPQSTGYQIRQNPRGPRISNRAPYFVPQTYISEAIGTFGNVHRDPYHGPGINNTNVILAKNFPLGQDSIRRLQLRMESDNAFNHTQFSNPNSGFSDSVPAQYSTTSFGRISSSAAARLTQLAAKIYF